MQVYIMVQTKQTFQTTTTNIINKQQQQQHCLLSTDNNFNTFILKEITLANFRVEID